MKKRNNSNRLSPYIYETLSMILWKSKIQYECEARNPITLKSRKNPGLKKNEKRVMVIQ
ncbi:MAG: hypothetical protein WBC06_15260 [Chitinophagaceae bacterium]